MRFRWSFVITLLVAAILCIAAVNQSTLETAQSGWVTAGTFSATTAEPTTPNQANRTFALMAAVSKVQVFTIPASWNAIILRNNSTTDGDTTVYDVFLMRGTSDHYSRVCTQTWTTGTQTSGTSGSEFADTLVLTNNTNTFHNAGIVVSPEGNYIAEYSLDVAGCTSIAFVPTTLTNDAVLEISGW